MSNQYIKKQAGILDVPQDTLASDIWTTEGKLYPHIRDQILNRLYAFVPKKVVRSVVILGSITGYKYTETSDVDINVTIEPYGDYFHQAKKEVNGYLAQGTRHPVNYFVMPHTSKLSNWENSTFGVFDVISNVWANNPPARATVRDPHKQFNQEFIIAKMVAGHYKRLVLAFHKDKKDLETLIALPDSWHKWWWIRNKKKEINEDRQDLINFSQNLDKSRKLEYSLGWGTPRNNYRNVVYKFIEHGPHGELFEKFKEIKLNNGK